MRAVTVLVIRVRIATVEVPTAQIIDVAVGIVIDSIAGNLGAIRPDVRGQVRVPPRNTCIDDRHGKLRVAGGHTPGFFRAHVHTGDPRVAGDYLSGVLEAPQLSVVRVIRNLRQAHDAIALDILHPRSQSLQRHMRRHTHHKELDTQLAFRGAVAAVAHHGAHGLLVAVTYIVRKLDQHPRWVE